MPPLTQKIRNLFHFATPNRDSLPFSPFAYDDRGIGFFEGSRAVNAPRGRILVIDDEQEVRQVLEDILQEQGLAVDVAATSQDALNALETKDYDVVLTDHFLGDEITGVELCAQIAQRWPTLPTIILTAYGNLDVAVSALKANAFDFLTKPCRTEQLEEAISHALEAHAAREKVLKLKGYKGPVSGFGQLIGESRVMRPVYQVLNRASSTDLTVLITGEIGTGKSQVARTLHQKSNRKIGPFIEVHCQSKTAEELDQEIFAPQGAFDQAMGGTLLFDEVSELPLETQGKLLRALKDKRARPGTPQFLDVRVLASNREVLKPSSANGAFREDLYYRLNVLHVHLPALRDRANDILLLTQHFLLIAARESQKDVAGFSPEIAARLLGYGWPGNVRELENVIHRAVTLAEHKELNIRDLPEEIQATAETSRGFGWNDPEDLPSLADLEQEHISRVLSATAGNKQKSARILGVDRSTLYRKMARYGIVWGNTSGGSQPPP